MIISTILLAKAIITRMKSYTTTSNWIVQVLIQMKSGTFDSKSQALYFCSKTVVAAHTMNISDDEMNGFWKTTEFMQTNKYIRNLFDTRAAGLAAWTSVFVKNQQRSKYKHCLLNNNIPKAKTSIRVINNADFVAIKC